MATAIQTGTTGRILAFLKSALLAVAGTAGALCIAWFIAAPLLNLSIVVVTTGSMSPTLPAGGAAMVVPVAASELRVGDVVTVPRPESRLPVTHRIVSIDTVPGEAAARSLVLRGDANDTNDRAPYVLQEARRVIVGAPLVGYGVLFLQMPIVMGLVTLLVAALVLWTFWPRRDRATESEIPDAATDAASAPHPHPAGRPHHVA